MKRWKDSKSPTISRGHPGISAQCPSPRRTSSRASTRAGWLSGPSWPATAIKVRHSETSLLDLAHRVLYGHPMSGLQRGAYQVWRVLVALIAVACVVQIFLAGRGAFGVHGAAKLDDQKSFDPHRALGEIIGLLAVLAFLAALIAWRNKQLIWLTLALAVMAEVLQQCLLSPSIRGLQACTHWTVLRSSVSRRGLHIGHGADRRPPLWHQRPRSAPGSSPGELGATTGAGRA